MKLIHMLMTAVLASKGSKMDNNVRNVILAVAFLMEDDIINQIWGNHRGCSLQEFVSATSTSQAETTMSLKSISIQLETVVSSLGAVVKKLVTMPAPSIALAKLTWAKIASAGPPLSTQPISAQFKPGIPAQATATLAAVDSIPPPNQMLVQGITALEQGTYLFELDLAELAMWFWNYAQDPKWELAKTCLGSSAWVI
ncbi:hypothetical protein C0989_003570, partial [Termitomyces sp. Mn162]